MATASTHMGTRAATAGLLAVLAALLTACGGGGGGSDDASAGAAESTVRGPDASAIVVPGGALDGPITVRIAKDSTNAPPLPPAFTAAGDVYDFTPNGQPLRMLATVTIPVDAATGDDVVLAESGADGLWTLRADTLRDGASLSIAVSRLGQVRAVRLTTGASARGHGVRALGASPAKASGTIELAAPGFALDVGKTDRAFPVRLTNPTPYVEPAVVAVTASPVGPDAAKGVCPEARFVQTESYYQIEVDADHATGRTVRVRGYQLFDAQKIALADAGPPWRWDLYVHRPYAIDALPETRTRAIFLCQSGASRYWVAAAQALSYTVPQADAVGFLRPVDDVTAGIGAAATFQVRVFGGPVAPTASDAYEVFWEASSDGKQWQPFHSELQQDGTTAPDAASRTHAASLANVTAADNGTMVRARACYRPPGGVVQCATSGAGVLTVVQLPIAPSVVQQPQSVTALVGETASFSVAAAGTPAPKIQWQVLDANGSKWLDVGSARWPETSGSASTLVTPPGSLADSGTLVRAQLTNAAGTITSDSAYWRVSASAIAPSFIVQPASASAPLGADAVLAAAVEGSAPLSYQWTRNDVPVAGATSPILRLADVQASDFATYRLIVTGPGGSATSSAAALTEATGPAGAVAPLVTTQPAPANVAAGTRATFFVAVTGTPSPACQWTRNGIAIVGAASCASYTTPPTEARDNGAVFNVIVSNAGGTAIGGGAVLTVQGGAPATSWEFLPTGIGTTLYGITIVGGDPDRVVAVSALGSILRSTDGGRSWSEAYRPADPRGLLRVRFVDAQVGLAVGPSDILRTDDGGATWTQVWRGEDHQAGFLIQRLAAVAWLDPDTAIAIGLSRVWRSTDRGLTWSIHGTFDFVPSQAINGVHFANAQIGVAISNYRMYRTADGGLNWTELPGSFSSFLDPLYGLGHGSTDQEWVAVGGAGIYRSTDGGVTWSRTAFAGGYLLGLAAHGSEMAGIGDNGVFIRSTNGGASWSAGPNLGFGQLWGVDFAAARTFVSGTGGIAARHD